MLSIIIPAHNEESRITRTLESYALFFRKKKERKEIKDFEIIVVANACRDKTVNIVENMKKRFKEIRLLNFKQGGKGFAIKKGFKDALTRNAKLIGFVDADMATPPEAFYDLVRQIGKYKAIIASRYLKGSKIIPKFTFRRLIASRVFNLLVRSLFFFPYKDTQCGAKLIKRKTLEKILPKLTISQWAFDIDLLYNLRKSGVMVKEIPTLWREIEGSKINLKKTSLQMFLDVVKLRILTSPAKKFFKFFKPIARALDNLVK